MTRRFAGRAAIGAAIGGAVGATLGSIAFFVQSGPLAFIIGSSVKSDGVWSGVLDAARIRAIVDALAS